LKDFEDVFIIIDALDKYAKLFEKKSARMLLR